MTSPLVPEPDRHVFEWKKFGFVQALPRELVMPPGVTRLELSADETLGFFTEQIFLKLKAYVLTHQLAEHEATRTSTVEWPATPWQHWKHRHGGSWWLRWFVVRRPVRMQTQVVDYREVWHELAAYPWQDRVPMVDQFGKPTRIVQVLKSEWINSSDMPGDAE